MRIISIMVLSFAVFPKACLSQGLDLKQVNDRLIIESTSVLRLSYLPADQFQNLDWEPGYVYYLDGSSRQFDGMKYDPEQDLIQVSASGNVLTLLPGIINGVSMESEDFVTRIFAKVPMGKSVFMEALSTGKIHLLMYRKVKAEKSDMYKESDATNILLAKKEKPPVKFDEILYIWNQEGVRKFKNSKKSVLSLMDDHTTEMGKFIDENRISMKNISDLMKVFDFYNSL